MFRFGKTQSPEEEPLPQEGSAEEASLKAERDRMQAEVEGLGRARQAITNDIASEKKRMDDELADKRRENARILAEDEAAIEASRARRETAEKEAEESIARKNRLVVEEEQVDRSLVSKRRDLEGVEADIKRESERLAVIKAEISLIEPRLIELTQKRDNLVTEIAGLMVQRDDLEGKIKVASDALVKSVDAEIVATKNREDLEAALKDVDAELATKRSELSETVNKVNDARTELARVTTETNAAHERIAARERAVLLLEKNVDAKILIIKQEETRDAAQALANDKGLND